MGILRNTPMNTELHISPYDTAIGGVICRMTNFKLSNRGSHTHTEEILSLPKYRQVTLIC